MQAMLHSGKGAIVIPVQQCPSLHLPHGLMYCLEYCEMVLADYLGKYLLN